MEGLVMLIFLFLVLGVPFFINASLAKSRGKSVAFVMLLTLLFNWLITIILFFLPETKKQQ